MKLINGILTPDIMTFENALQVKTLEVLSESKKEVFDIDEAAQFLKVPTQTIKNYAKKKMISWHLVGKEKVFRKEDLLNFLERRKVLHHDF